MKTALLIFLTSFRLMAGDFQTIQPLTTQQYNNNPELCCFVDWGTSGWLSNSEKFPDESVYDMQTKSKVKISSLVKNRPIVIQIGSLTCPSYDLNVGKIKSIQKEYKGKVDFYTLYTRENHPSGLHSAHKNFEQKLKFAEKLKKNSHIDHKFLIDDVDGTLHQKLGNFGNSIYLIGKDMHVNHWSIFPHATSLKIGIKNLLEHNGLAANAPFNGGSATHSLISDEFTTEEKIVTQKKMKELDGPNTVDEKQVIALYDQFTKEQPELYKRFKPEVFGKMKSMSVFKVKNDMGNIQNKMTWNNLFMLLHQDYKGEYQKRYNEWKMTNHKTDTENVVEKVVGK